MTQAGAQMMNWFSVACELHRDWRNDIEGLGNLLSQRIPNYRNLMNSYSALTQQKYSSHPKRKPASKAGFCVFYRTPFVHCRALVTQGHFTRSGTYR